MKAPITLLLLELNTQQHHVSPITNTFNRHSHLIPESLEPEVCGNGDFNVSSSITGIKIDAWGTSAADPTDPTTLHCFSSPLSLLFLDSSWLPREGRDFYSTCHLGSWPVLRNTAKPLLNNKTTHSIWGHVFCQNNTPTILGHVQLQPSKFTEPVTFFTAVGGRSTSKRSIRENTAGRPS